MKNDVFSDFIKENQILHGVEIHSAVYCRIQETEIFHFETANKWFSFAFACGGLTKMETSKDTPLMPVPTECDCFYSCMF